MHIATGVVVEGRVALDGASLPEGTQVTVLTHDTAPIVVLPPHFQAELEDALDEADGEPDIPAEELFADLQRFG